MNQNVLGVIFGAIALIYSIYSYEKGQYKTINVITAVLGFIGFLGNFLILIYQFMKGQL